MTIYPPIYLQAIQFTVVNDHIKFNRITNTEHVVLSIEFPKYQLIKGWKMVCGSNMAMESGAITIPSPCSLLACHMS